MAVNVVMSPAAGAQRVAHVGDTLRIELRCDAAAEGRALLRTDVGRADERLAELAAPITGHAPVPGAALHDLPMHAMGEGLWSIELALADVGHFRAKAFLIDEQGVAHWPDGDDMGVNVHPAWTRSGNTIYCAFTRMFGRHRRARRSVDGFQDEQLAVFDRHGWTVIPPSGTFRDLSDQLDHIVNRLGCRILHLLPVNPTPTTYARFGRFGSPYASLDLTAVDPALVEFDRRSTGIDQFRELCRATHRRGARVMLDLAINHTGWGSWLQERHPEWFLRNDDGSFHSPGAWGVVWEDLVELEPRHRELWSHLAEAFLCWCERGVDGFRCDAGYMVPLPVWQAVIARVRQAFPDVVFLLEGLGGAWHDSEALLTDGGMQWAYSELFQNYSGRQVHDYLDHAFAASAQSGLLVHYSETHDNDRLAARGRAWSLRRSRLCARTRVRGGIGFTCGVEWLADEKLLVHQDRGLNWGSEENIVPHLSQLNRLLRTHPCFRDGAHCKRLSPPGSEILLLERIAPDGDQRLLIAANTDARREQRIALPQRVLDWLGDDPTDLLEPTLPSFEVVGGSVELVLPPARCCCLQDSASRILHPSDDYQLRRAQHAFAVRAIAAVADPQVLGSYAWRDLAGLVDEDATGLLGGLERLRDGPGTLVDRLRQAGAAGYPTVCEWRPADAHRIVPIPQGHWLLLRLRSPFRARILHDAAPIHLQSIPAMRAHIAAVAPATLRGLAALEIDVLDAEERRIEAELLQLTEQAQPPDRSSRSGSVLLSNGRGGMAHMRVDLGEIASKYDCVLAANLHDEWPVDRHVFVKRLRAWMQVDGFVFPVDGRAITEFQAGPPARWRFAAPAGAGRCAAIELTMRMCPERNEVLLRWRRSAHAAERGRALPDEIPLRLIVRFDLEDRNFHQETHRSPGAEAHFREHIVADDDGFSFEAAPDRRVQLRCSNARFHAEGEWSMGIEHAIDAERGQVPSGDAYSPGWVSIDLGSDDEAALILSAEADTSDPAETCQRLLGSPEPVDTDTLPRRLSRAAEAYLVRRGQGRSVIAGYPWFLDWGRDTLICARGLLADDRHDEVLDILRVFGRFESHGTLPNCIHGGDASNRDSSDAPLWYAVVLEECAAAIGAQVYEQRVDDHRTLRDVVRNIACGLLRGAPNGVTIDPDSALLWSPSHFTWMDTNHPAGTPREGYPIEIQVLWWRMLRLLAALGAAPAEGGEPWASLAKQVHAGITERFWLAEHGWLADLLHAEAGVPARRAVPDSALRPNAIFAVSLDCLHGDRARAQVAASMQHLLVPGALRSLAPLPVDPPLHVRDAKGVDLIDPRRPYQGRYLGDEDSRRKPAYHNGTAWTWPFPSLCEALVKAWDADPAAQATARSLLSSSAYLLDEGCREQIPELLDGDAPHRQRGCDAQAWGVTEALRVWRWLEGHTMAARPSDPLATSESAP